MRTRISKHGKYEIMEGVASEVGDSLKPGDILIVTSHGRLYELEVVNLIATDDDLAYARLKLSPTRALAAVRLRDMVRDLYAKHPYLVRNVRDGSYDLWTALVDDSPVKIKHPLRRDEPIVAEQVEAGTITANKVYTDDTVKVPNMPGLYKDNQGDYVLFHRHMGSPTLLYTYFTLAGKVCVWHETVEAEHSEVLLGAAPFARVTAIKDVEVEQ